MVKETPFAEGSIEWESCAVGECSEIHTGSLWETCHGLIQIWGSSWDTCLGQTPCQSPTLPFQREETNSAQMNAPPASTAAALMMM